MTRELLSSDFFLMDHLKNNVNASKPKNNKEVKVNIRAEITYIPPEMFKNVVEKPQRVHILLWPIELELNRYSIPNLLSINN